MQELVQTMHLLHLFRHRSFVENLKMFTFVQLVLHGMVGQLEKSLDRRREAHWHGENCLSFSCEATVIITTKYQMRRADDSVFEYI